MVSYVAEFYNVFCVLYVSIVVVICFIAISYECVSYVKTASGMIQHCGRWCVQLYSISILLLPTSVGIDLKELGVRCRNVWNFAQRL